MSSTNKTTNYNLSQFIGTDKPAWLSDYNQDMSKIDTGIHNAATTATGADGKADAATTAIGDLTTLTTTAKTDLVSAVNEVDTEVGTASGVATGAATTATQAKNKADGIENYLTLSTSGTVTFTTTAGTFQTGKNSISIRTNNTKSLGKFYGELSITNIPSSVSTITITSSDTGIRPASAITFNCCALLRKHSQTYGHYRSANIDYTLNTNGTITITADVADTPDLLVEFLAVVLFIIDFGDVPLPE